jgi:hypothetical protein
MDAFMSMIVSVIRSKSRTQADDFERVASLVLLALLCTTLLPLV